MGKAKVRFDAFEPVVSANEAITGRASKGSVGSRTWSNTDSSKRPLHRAAGFNAKLHPAVTSASFDGSNDSLELSSAESFLFAEAWFWVFAFVDLDTSADRVLAHSSDVGGYIGISSGGTGIIFKSNSSKSSELAIATNNTDNGTISYTFGSDVEVLIMIKQASSNELRFFNIDGDHIATNITAGSGTGWNLDTIGIRGSSDPFEGQLLDVRFYNGSDCPPFTTVSFQAIGNYYKQFKD